VTYYDILKIPESATIEEIRAAYRALARVHHPDKSSGDEENFKIINEAHQVLSNPSRRSMYDLGLLAARRSAANQPATEETVAKERDSPQFVRYDETASGRNIFLCVLIFVLAFACALYGDRPAPNYNGWFVALFWVFVILGVSLFRYRMYRFANLRVMVWATTIDTARLLLRCFGARQK
jgi:curved DNA-binding protein CbpA